MANSSMTYLAIDTLQALPVIFQHINEDSEDSEEMSIVITNNVDDCFTSMSSDWQLGNYLNIVEYANNQPIYCLCDIRICVYYLYSLWASQKEITSETLFIILNSILNHPQAPWKATLVNQTDKSINNVSSNSVALLLRKIINHLDNPNTQERIGQEKPEQVLRALNNLHTTVNKRLSPPTDVLENAFVSIKECYSLLEQQQQQEHEKNNTQQAVLSVVENNTVAATKPANVKPTMGKEAIDNNNLVDLTLFNPSHALKQLFRHILLFQDLIKQNDQLKAAVVLNDIQQELDNFNPLHYFPEYFTSFASLRAKHGAKLAPLFDQQDSYQWKVLSECYKTNIEAFLTIEDAQTEWDRHPDDKPIEDYLDDGYHE
jgi:hypothetical protein